MAAFLARAASFLAQADSFHLLSISASGETPSGQPTSLVGLSNGVALIGALDGNHVVGEVEVVQLRVTLAKRHPRPSAVSSRQWQVRRRAPSE